MKLHSDANDSSLRVTAYDAHSVSIGDRDLSATFIITPQTLFVDLPEINVQRLRWHTLHALHDLEIDVLLVGTGSRQQFPGAEFYAELSSQRIGLEVMTSPAACRTYNILAAEQRRVGALITFDRAPASDAG